MESKSILCCAIALACLAAMVPPKPKLPHHSAAVHQGAGALSLISPKLRTVTAPSLSVFLTWQYPTNINRSNYWWNIEQSDSLRGPWSVLVSNASGTFTVTVDKTKPLRVYRLSGRLTP